MKTLFRYLLACIFLVLLSCENTTDEGLNTDAPLNVTSFTINGKPATIDNVKDEITLTLPYGTNLSALIPQIGLPAGAISSIPNGASYNFLNPVTMRIKNGNIFKDYHINIKAANPIVSFVALGQNATIDYASKTIKLIVPDGTNLSNIKPEITLSEGVTISPASGQAQDFTKPVIYVVKGGSLTENYTANIVYQSAEPVVAFIGVAANRGSLTNPDEIAAADWFFSKYVNAKYVSFADITAGTKLSDYKLLWWHYDSAQALPDVALTPAVLLKIKNYLSNGGNILLTSFASQYLDPLGIIPSGKGPNNVFGDFLPAGFIDYGSDWGIAFRQGHPIFQGLQTYEAGKANLLQKGTYRLNHTAWWFLPDWGGYGNGAGWRAQTGGNNLASEAWDTGLDGRVAISEFPGDVNAPKNCIEISLGAYDWYNESANNVPSAANGYLDNIKTLTANSITYLISH